MNYSLRQKLYVIQWFSDYKINITTGFQIESIHHSEKKWYNKIPQMKVLREASIDDINKYKYEGEKFLCPKE